MTARWTLSLAGVLLLAAGCSERPAGDEPASAPRTEPVVVYADAPGEAVLEPVFAA